MNGYADALVEIIRQQADRIAWLEGDVAGWRIKLAAAREALERIAESAICTDDAQTIARAALVNDRIYGTPSEDA